MDGGKAGPGARTPAVSVKRGQRRNAVPTSKGNPSRAVMRDFALGYYMTCGLYGEGGGHLLKDEATLDAGGRKRGSLQNQGHIKTDGLTDLEGLPIPTQASRPYQHQGNITGWYSGRCAHQDQLHAPVGIATDAL